MLRKFCAAFVSRVLERLSVIVISLLEEDTCVLMNLASIISMLHRSFCTIYYRAVQFDALEV